MSYEFLDASNGEAQGTFTTAIDVSATGLTLALWLKYSAHPVSTDYLLALSADLTNNEDFCSVNLLAVADRYGLSTIAAGGTPELYNHQITEADGTYDNPTPLWHPVVATFASDSSRTLRINTFGNSSSETSTTVTTGNLDSISLGCAPNRAANILSAKFAEVAIWNKVLDQTDIESYMSGTAASGISASNLRGYWPLDTDTGTELSNAGEDATGTLTGNAGTNFVIGDHPTITGSVDELSMGGVIVLP